MPTEEPCVAGFTIMRQAQALDAVVEIGGRAQHHVVGGRNAHGLRQALGAQLVHADGRAHDAAAGVRQPEEFERALQRAVFAAGAVQRDEHAIELARDEFAERLVASDRTRCASTPRFSSAARQALPDFSEISRSLDVPPSNTATRPNSARLGDVTDDLGVVTQAHQSGSPTMRNSGVSAHAELLADDVCWICATSFSTSAAVAASTLTRKFACLGETMMSPMRKPLRPAASMRRAA